MRDSRRKGTTANTSEQGLLVFGCAHDWMTARKSDKRARDSLAQTQTQTHLLATGVCSFVVVVHNLLHWCCGTRRGDCLALANCDCDGRMMRALDSSQRRASRAPAACTTRLCIRGLNLNLACRTTKPICLPRRLFVPPPRREKAYFLLGAIRIKINTTPKTAAGS